MRTWLQYVHIGVDLLYTDRTDGLSTLAEMEKHTIACAQEQFEGHVSQAAKSLGVSRPAIYRKLKNYGMETG